MSQQDILMNRYRMSPEPGEPQPETDEEKEERAETDTRMLYKRMENIFTTPAAFTCGA